MKVRLTLIIITIALSIFVNMGHAQASPETVVERYLAAVRAGDYETAYTYISSNDDDIIEWLELIRYIRREGPEPVVSLIDLAHSISRQRIAKTTIDGDRAVVEVDSIVPDMAKALNAVSSGGAAKAMFEYGVPPMKTRHGICELAVEDGEWKITCVRGVSAGQAAELATELAEKILTEEDAARLVRQIKDFQKGRKEKT
ncbi:MAG: hypothetical protein ACYSRP_06255 [Planctomycetota bacterium]|jgi:hypothetical protein